MKDGRKNIKSKEAETSYTFNPSNLLEVPRPIQQQMESEGKQARFISYKAFVANGGHHKNHWKPYKVDYAKMGLNTDFVPGQDASGYIRRGDMVLAERSVEIGKQHRAMLNEKLARQRKAAKRTGLEELKEAARAVGSRVVDGYGEDE